MQIVRPGLADNVDGGATGSAQLRGIAATVDLEFLHCILTQVHLYSARIAVELSAIYGDVISSTITAVEGETGLRRLPDVEVGSHGTPSITHARKQQGVTQVVAL